MTPKNKRRKVATVQQSLEQGSILPLIKKPMEMIGKQINVPGKHWGSSATAAEQKKMYVCTVVDFSLKHVFDEGKDTEYKADAFKLTEMGEDGSGGASEDFWMIYPHPFLRYFYDTFPNLLESNATPAARQPLRQLMLAPAATHSHQQQLAKKLRQCKS